MASMLISQPSRPGSRGFILFIVITVMLMVAILAFSFAAMKSGTIEQLGKNIDQNRLSLIAQAANNEALAFFKTEVNRPGTAVFTACRKDIFDQTRTLPSLPFTLYSALIDESHTLPSTRSIAESVPAFEIKVKTTLTVVALKKVNTIRMNAFAGHLEVVSQARDRYKNSVEIKERRDLKLVDLRDFFDKYVLYVKNYGPDYNEPSRSLVVNGLPPGQTNFGDGTYSRIYLGNRFHPPTAEAARIGGERMLPIHFDFDFNHPADGKLLATLLGSTARSTFQPLHAMARTMAQDNTVWARNPPIDFQSLPSKDRSELYQHPQIVKLYLDIVQAARTAANSADPGARGRSVAGAILSDFGNANGNDYSPCQVFQGCVQTFMDSWKYHYGYTDAAHLWKLESPTREAQDFLKYLPYSGLNTYPSENTAGSPPYNTERFRIGRMAKLFGTQGDRPVMIEGPCYLRFFKVAFFDEFTAKLKAIVPHWGMTPSDALIDFSIPAVPLDYVSPASTSAQAAFLRKVRPVDSTWGGKGKVIGTDGLEEPLMSRAVDTLPFNRLLPENPSRIKLQPAGSSGPAQRELYDPKTGVAPFPEQKGNNGVPTPGENFFPVIDPAAFTYFYKTSQAFLEERVTGDAGGKVLNLDGRMFIESGDLDLKDIRVYRGHGTILLGKGHCFLGTLKRSSSTTLGPSTLRIFLQKGDFVISGNDPNVEIQASLIATTWCDPSSGMDPQSRDNQGKLRCNQKNVHIFGNLVLDYLFIQSDATGTGLKPTGELRITHDEEIFSPTVPVRVSVGAVRTLYSLNAGGQTF